MLDGSALSVAEELATVVRLGVLRVRGLHVSPTKDQPDDAGHRPNVTSDAVREARLGLVRAMYRRFGIDPTKTRPSSEALWRRVKRGQPFPRINSLVDACNACSLEMQLPYGLYDLDRVSGAIVFRAGAPGEEYAGIRKSVVHLDGRPALADDRGPFGNPTSDSARTMITTGTTRALVVIYAPHALDAARLRDALGVTAARVRQAAGGVEEGRWVV